MTWRLTDAAIRAATSKLHTERMHYGYAEEVRAVSEAQARELVEWFSRQLFDDDNMDEPLVMYGDTVVKPQWLVQLRMEVGLEK